MKNKFFTYHELGECSRCHWAGYLFIADREKMAELHAGFASSYSEEPECLKCHWGYLNDWNNHYVRREDYDIVTAIAGISMYFPNMAEDYPAHVVGTCQSCELPLVENSGRWSAVNAQVLSDDNSMRTIIVHRHCTTQSCVICDISYARRHWNYSSYRTPVQFQIPNSSFLEMIPLNNQPHCSPCYDIRYQDGEWIECNYCGNNFTRVNMSRFDDDLYCESCYDDQVSWCEGCDQSYWGEDGHDCPEYDSSEYIHNYSYHPVPQFHGEGKYYLGFELELEVRGNESLISCASVAHDNFGSRAYLKEDGSLEHGFEIVTHPHTLEGYKDFNWQGLRMLKTLGCRSWNTETCGLHVHVSRTAFGEQFDRENFPDKYAWHSARTISRESHELRFMKLIYDNERQVQRIAGRSSNYASFDDKGKLVHKVKYGNQSNGRYSAVNTENSDTLEVRVFRGSLRVERVKSALEFVHACVEYTRDLKISGNSKALSWLKFAGYVSANMDKYSNLALIMNETFNNDNSTDDDVR